MDYVIIICHIKGLPAIIPTQVSSAAQFPLTVADSCFLAPNTPSMAFRMTFHVIQSLENNYLPPLAGIAASAGVWL